LPGTEEKDEAEKVHPFKARRLLTGTFLHQELLQRVHRESTTALRLSERGLAIATLSNDGFSARSPQ
jgi:hypothetical protein